MITRFLGKIGRKLSKAAAGDKLLLFVGAILDGLVALAAMFLFSLLSVVPEPTVPFIGITIPAWALVFLVTFLFTLIFGFIAIYFQKNRAQWRQLPDPVRALVVGLVTSTLAVVGLAIADVWYGIALYHYVLTFLLGLSFVTFGMVRYYQRQGDIHSDRSTAELAVARTGFAQMERLATRTVSAIIGFIVAVLVGALTQYFAIAAWITVIVGLTIWLLTTIILYNRFETWAQPRARSDLSIVRLADRESDDSRELAVKNEGTDSADLAKAKIRDTNNDLYWLDIDAELAPGETYAFEIPEEFSLEPSETGVDLPLGYTLKQGAETAIVYSRAGEEMRLRQSDEI